MPNITNREAAEALIRQQIIDSIVQDAPKSSIVMQLGRRLPNMTSNQTRMRVLDTLPTAYWVDGDTGFKQTSMQAWDNVYINAGELAVIVPIPEAVVADSDTDLIGEITPRINESIGKRFDAAILFGENRPAAWQNDIITVARQAGNNVADTADKDLYDKIMSEGGLLNKVEEDGYAVNGAIAALGMRAKLRGLRTNDGLPIFKSDMQGTTPYALDGAPMYFPENGSFDKTIAQMIVGDFRQLVWAIRQDITVKILDQGVIQDPITKAIQYNLAQQDMIAIRVVFRAGWALPNPATRLNEDRTGCAFAYLEPATPVTTQKVTVTVKDNAETPTVIEGASVDVNGSILKTDASGVAEFNLRAGDYPVKIKKPGYKAVNDNITVASAAVAKAVTLPKA